jgi:hypothetical protein
MTNAPLTTDRFILKTFLCLFLLISSAAFAQPAEMRLLASIKTEADLFTADNQGNVYVVKDGELSKYDHAGKLLYKYSNKNLGKISSVDASNMLRILVYYKDFSQVVFLDNTLSLTGEPVSFDKLGYPAVSLACAAHNNGMWIFDEQNSAIVLLGSDYEKTQKTENLSTLLNMSIQPVEMLEYDNRVYLNDTAHGILVFDIYGTYYKTIPYKEITHFQPVRDQVYYMRAGEQGLYSYNLKTTEETEFSRPSQTFDSFYIGVESLIVRDAEGVRIYAPAH